MILAKKFLKHSRNRCNCHLVKFLDINYGFKVYVKRDGRPIIWISSGVGLFCPYPCSALSHFAPSSQLLILNHFYLCFFLNKVKSILFCCCG